MKPRIKTRLANIVAKLAGSKDYDPKVKPETPLEYYLEQLPVVPRPKSTDNGKLLLADNDGTYMLANPTVPEVTPEDVESAISEMSSLQKTSVRNDLVVEPEAMVINVTYDELTDTYTCDKTYAQINVAYTAKRPLKIAFVKNDETLVFNLVTYLPDNGFVFSRVLNNSSARFYVGYNPDNQETVCEFGEDTFALASDALIPVCFYKRLNSTSSFIDHSWDEIEADFTKCVFFYRFGYAYYVSLSVVNYTPGIYLHAVGKRQADPNDPTTITTLDCQLTAQGAVTITET